MRDNQSYKTMKRPDVDQFTCPMCTMGVVSVYEWPSGGMTLTTACGERWKWRSGDGSLSLDDPVGPGLACMMIADRIRPMAEAIMAWRTSRELAGGVSPTGVHQELWGVSDKLRAIGVGAANTTCGHKPQYFPYKHENGNLYCSRSCCPEGIAIVQWPKRLKRR